MKTHNGQPIGYAGDGIYVTVDAVSVWLHTGYRENPTNRIYIEDAALDAILKIRKHGRRLLKLDKKEE